MYDIPAVPRPLTAQAVFERLERIHAELVISLRAEDKTEDWMPAWYAHLPSGEKVRIKWIGRAGSLVRFTSPEGRSIILAPDAVVVTIDPLPGDSEGFPMEFLGEDEP